MFVLHDFVEPNGKTIRENNLERTHAIQIGTLVEVKFDDWCGGGACMKIHARLWVVRHGRDCDGTPLYSLDTCQEPFGHPKFNGFSERSLTPVEVTPAIVRGEEALCWPDD